MTNETKGKTERIRGKVARILNSREVAINVGSKNGVQPDMYFDILHDVGQDIKDPDTGEVLGSVERAKVRVMITHIQEKMSLASTYKTKNVNIGGSGPNLDFASSFSRVLNPPKWIKKYETLKTEEKTWEELDEKNSYVKTGDPVVQVLPILIEEEIQDGERATYLAETS